MKERGNTLGNWHFSTCKNIFEVSSQATLLLESKDGEGVTVPLSALLPRAVLICLAKPY